MTADHAVVVLAGGRSTRFGGDKLAAALGAGSVLDATLAGLPADWPVVVVGPERPTSRPVTWVREEPPLGGPLAGVAAGVGALAASVQVVAVVAGDMPWSGPALPVLVAALRQAPDADAAAARDGEGHVNPLLAAYRVSPLRAVLPADPSGKPAKLLLRELSHLAVPVVPALARDVDTPQDLP